MSDEISVVVEDRDGNYVDTYEFTSWDDVVRVNASGIRFCTRWTPEAPR